MKSIIFIISIIMLSLGYSQALRADGNVITTEIPYGGSNSTNKFPQKPAYSPLYCEIYNDHIVVYCKYQVEGEVTVVDNRNGEVIADDYSELSCGYVVILPDAPDGNFALTVVINGRTYFTLI